MTWLKCQSVYHTKHHMTSKNLEYCTQVMHMDYLWYFYDTFMHFFVHFWSWQSYFYLFCRDSLKNCICYTVNDFFIHLEVFDKSIQHHLTAKQTFWVSNILKFLTLNISIWHFDIFSHTMHHTVMTCYDVNGKWRNCCPKQSIFKIWIEMPLFFPQSTISLINTNLPLAQITAIACCLVTSLDCLCLREKRCFCVSVPVFLYFSNNNVYTTHPSKFLTARPLMMVFYMKRGHYFAICHQWIYLAAWYEA